ncbi:hypothetical protein PC116_g19642 [Phytophthora cactorum]|nr:hypothetical protein PC116_g19642 [Phytophthora cactorum]
MSHAAASTTNNLAGNAVLRLGLQPCRRHQWAHGRKQRSYQPATLAEEGSTSSTSFNHLLALPADR